MTEWDRICEVIAAVVNVGCKKHVVSGAALNPYRAPPRPPRSWGVQLADLVEGLRGI